MKQTVLFIFSCLSFFVLVAQPQITGFSPSTGPIGTPVTITGSNFSPTPSANIVFFGAVRANVTAASAASLTVSVPYGATYEPITVTTGGLTGFASRPFVVTFTGGDNAFTAGSFGQPYHHPVTNNVNFGLVSKDLDNDGKTDIAIINYIAGYCKVYKNLSNNSNIILQTVINPGGVSGNDNFSFGPRPVDVVSEDINGDGKPDLITINSPITPNNPVDSVSILLNNSTVGNIAFQPYISFPVGKQPKRLCVQDLDNDGKPDITVAYHTFATQGSFPGSGITVLKNTSSNGNISFSRTDYVTGLQPTDIVIQDIDNDGLVDMLTGNIANSDAGISIFKNISTTAGISFAGRIDLNTGFKSDKVLLADINNDQKPDLIASSYNDSMVYTKKNTSIVNVISFDINTVFALSSNSYRINTADLNGDARPDICATTWNNSLEVLKNTTAVNNITFAPRVKYSYQLFGKMVLSDIQGDGKLDVIALTPGSAAYEFFVSKNKTNEVSIANINPAIGGYGTSVYITGTNFTNASSVRFGNQPVLSFSIISSDSIVAVLGNGIPGSALFVTTPLGTDSLNGFSYIQRPIITSFAPTSAGTGDLVTITGNNFDIADTVSFGGKPAQSFTIISPTVIKAVVGRGASGKVKVSNPGGKDSLSGFVYIPRPVISSFTPQSGGAGSLITVAGFNFSGTSAVSFGATPANTFTVVNDSVLTATVSNGASGYLKVTNAFDSDSLYGFNFSPPPSISSFTPSSGSAGNPVYITGNGFTGATQVFFGNVAANYFSINSDSQITAYPGSGASGYIKVISPGGRDSSAGFTFIYPPVINSFSPPAAFAGTTVSIHGNHFNTTSAVSFGSNPADSFIIVSDTLIHAVVASGSSGNITVINIAGSANASGFVYLSPPVISSFTPADAPAGNTVTIYGSYFTNITAVSFGGVPAASFAGISDNEIKAVTGSGSSGSIIVATPLGSDTISGFTFIPPPHISSFAPLSGGSGDTITITGNNLLNTSAVKLGGVAAASFTVLSATVIKAVIGSGASGPIKITTPGGTDSLAGFTYIPPPAISSFLPTAAASGSMITIKGTNFTGTTIVTLGGTAAASFSIINDSTITAIVGNGSSGSISITNKYGNSSLAGFTYLPPPLVSSFSPTTAATGATVTITGNHFSNATAVSFGGVSATSFTVISPTSISAVVGNGASGNISVTTPYGVGTKTGFTYLPPPSITSFTPQSGSFGTTITITGSNFANPVTVTIGNIPVAATVINSNTIQATVGAVASGNIMVSSNNGMASMGGFAYLPYRKYVTQTGAGLKTGNSWADAWSDSLFAANIYNQAAGTEIWIAKGTYKPNRNENGAIAGDPSLTFSVPNGVKLYGGFAGTETTFADRVPILIHTTNKTKLSADIGTIGFQGDNPGFAVKLTNCTNSETLDGLTISDATQTGISIHITTGMIAPPMVNNCIIQDNYPNGSTGGIEVNGSGASFFTTTNSSFRNNRGYSGGAIKVIGCTLRVSNSVFYENANQPNLFSASNSIFFSNGTGSVTNCTFFGNRSNTISTVIGLQNLQDSVFINNSIFWKNYDFSSVATNNINVISGSNMATVKNCLFQNQTLGTAPAVLLNSFSQDPFFEGETNPAGSDGLMNTADDGLRLTTCSPAINKGNNSFVVGLTKDILDNPRIFGSLVDLGAYEVQQSATTGINVQSQPVNLTVNTGDTAQLSAAATGGTIGYQWQTFNGSNWINLVSDTVYNNVQSPLLLINNVPFALNGKKYRCLFSNQFCSGYQSNEAVLTVRQQEIVTLCPGGGTTILGTIQGNPTVITTEWQVDTGTGYRPIVNNANYSGTTTSTLQLINIPSNWYGYKYRYLVNGSIYSQVFQLKFASRWTGTANNSWENPANWSCGQVPDGNTDLTIDVTTNGGVPSPSNVIVGTNSICRSLTVLSGGNTVTVLPGFTLTVVR